MQQEMHSRCSQREFTPNDRSVLLLGLLWRGASATVAPRGLCWPVTGTLGIQVAQSAQHPQRHCKAKFKFTFFFFFFYVICAQRGMSAMQSSRLQEFLTVICSKLISIFGFFLNFPFKMVLNEWDAVTLPLQSPAHSLVRSGRLCLNMPQQHLLSVFPHLKRINSDTLLC